MVKILNPMVKKVGLPPGTLVFTGEKKTESVKITVMDYNEEHLQECELENIDEVSQYKDTETVTWLNINGIHREDIIESIGKRFNIHPLVMEDIMNVKQRPKIEYYDDYVFIVLRMLSYDDSNLDIIDEQISLIIMKNFVISFQEMEGDVFDPIRERIRNSSSRMRKMGSDFLAYALMDIVVDNYFIILEKLAESAEILEDRLLYNPGPDITKEINALKRKLILMRKSIWPFREFLSTIGRFDSPIFTETTLLYFRDVYDHTIRLIDTIETLREIITDFLNMNLSSLSNRMNEIMKVLTIISTIFIPITFLAGIYGMNFKFMPELDWRLGYPIVWLIMLSIGGSMLIYFKKKKWF
ncbi:MAG: magnesium/cobalt transporter CorA [bacterium]